MTKELTNLSHCSELKSNIDFENTRYLCVGIKHGKTLLALMLMQEALMQGYEVLEIRKIQ
jgi:hypothetical protein